MGCVKEKEVRAKVKVMVAKKKEKEARILVKVMMAKEKETRAREKARNQNFFVSYVFSIRFLSHMFLVGFHDPGDGGCW